MRATMGSMGDDFQTTADPEFVQSYVQNYSSFGNTGGDLATFANYGGALTQQQLNSGPFPTLKPADFNSTQSGAGGINSGGSTNDPNDLNWNNFFAMLFGTAKSIIPAFAPHPSQQSAPGSFNDTQQNGPPDGSPQGGQQAPGSAPGNRPVGPTASLSSSPLFDPTKPYLYLIAGGAVLGIILLTRKSGR